MPQDLLYQYPNRLNLTDTHQFGPFDDTSCENSLEQLRNTLVKISKAMVAKKVSPAFLSTMIWKVTPKAKAFFLSESRQVDLIFREVFGGNYPVLTAEEAILDKGCDIVISATAAAPEVGSKKVYKHFTKAELDRAYGARAAVPEHQDLFDDWRKRSDIFRGKKSGQYITLDYGTAPSQRLDLYLPSNPQAGIPVHVFFHGGYWQAMSKDDHGFLAAPFVNSGKAFVAVDYSLCPQASFDEIYSDARQALVFLANQASHYGLHGKNWQIGGHSAGAQLAAMLATDKQVSAFISSLVLISGIFDLEPLRHCGMNRVLGLDPDIVARHSPLYLSPQEKPAAILAVGENESAEFHRQTNELADAWGAKAGKIVQVPLPGANHFTALEALANADSPLFASTLAALQS